MSALLRPMGHLTRVALLGVCVLLALLMGWVDAGAGPEIHLAVFYLIPLAGASWLLGARLGLGMALLCAVIWLGAEVAGGAAYTRDWILLWNAGALLVFFLLFALGLAHLRGALDAEARLAREDHLTSIPNLRSFREQMPQELREAAGRGSAVTLGLVEIHDLAYINERFGTQSGDLLLRVIARTLRASLRSRDLLCRIGGTTFAVILPGTDTPTATRVLEGARERVLEETRVYDRPLSIAIAAVAAERPPREGDELMEKTESILRAIKEDRSPHPFRVLALEQVAV
jgi:diguanylate cyclase (GGDEF)-like protein